MARLLDDLLDVSRFTQGKIQLRKKTPVDFVDRRGPRRRDRHARWSKPRATSSR